MKRIKTNRGFTLMELMVTISVTMVVLAGMMTMFTKINQSVVDTQRNNDFTFQNRSLVDLLRQDFTKAGKGMNDFSVFNVNHQFNVDFAGTASDGRLYPVADIAYDDTTQTSEIVLHYFDYDISGVAINSPTFFAILDAGDANAFGDGMTYINMLSNDETSIDSLAVGDIVMIYRFDALRQSKAFQEPDQSPWVDLRLDGFRTNDAILLEVTEVADKESVGTGDTSIQFKRTIKFGEGDVFTNNIDTSNIETRFETGIDNPDEVIDQMATWLFESSESNVPGLWQKGLFFARKLGNAESFRRIHYRVENRSGTQVLMRIENGTEEIIAENVQQFQIYLGVDVPKGFDPAVIQNDQMDGYVTSADFDQWTRAYNDPANSWSVTQEQFGQIIGRHSIAAMVKLVQQVSYPDPRTGEETLKDRAFEHQFKLSMSRPSQYQVGNPYE